MKILSLLSLNCQNLQVIQLLIGCTKWFIQSEIVLPGTSQEWFVNMNPDFDLHCQVQQPKVLPK